MTAKGKATAVEQAGSGRQHAIDAWLEWFGRGPMFWVVVMVAMLVYAQSGFWSQPSTGDRANWDYIAQVISRGGVPYRDAMEIKTPLSAYIGAAAIVASKPFGVRDIFAARVTFLVLAAFTAGLAFLIALDYSRSYRVAMLAAAIMMTFNAFAKFNAMGVQPKTAMIFFGLVALLAITKDRPVAAGVCGMLSALSWQPGLLFVGVAGLSFSSYLTSWRDLKAVKVIIAASIPLAIFIAYLFGAAALQDFYRWTLHFNATVYGPETSRPVSQFFVHLAKLVRRYFLNSQEFIYISVAGLSIAIVRESITAIKREPPFLESAGRHAVIIAPITYLAFCAINIQSGPDLIPLLPFLALFSAVALVWAVERLASLFRRLVKGDDNRRSVEVWGCVVLLVLILYRVLIGALSFEPEFPTLQDQDSELVELTSHLRPGDKIFTHGASGVLVLSGLQNASKYFYLDRGKDEYLDQIEYGGFHGWLERLRAERPTIVVLDRLSQTRYENDFKNWVASEYEPRQNRVFAYYLRRDRRD